MTVSQARLWTDKTEAELIRLWAKAEKESLRRPVTKKKQREWAISQLTRFLQGSALESAHAAALTDKTVKNKLDMVRKKGKILLRKHVLPLLRADAAKPAGGPSDDAELMFNTNALEKLDWAHLCTISRWPNFRVYFDYLGRHPSWGMFQLEDSDGDSDCDAQRSEQPRVSRSAFLPTGSNVVAHPARAIRRSSCPSTATSANNDGGCENRSEVREIVGDGPSPVLDYMPRRRNLPPLTSIDRDTEGGCSEANSESRDASTEAFSGRHAFSTNIDDVCPVTVVPGIRAGRAPDLTLGHSLGAPQAVKRRAPAVNSAADLHAAQAKKASHAAVSHQQEFLESITRIQVEEQERQRALQVSTFHGS